MTKTNYRSRIRSFRRILRGLTVLLIVSSIGVTSVIVNRPHMTLLVTVATVTAALVVGLLAWALRLLFRNLPEAEQLGAKFDDDVAIGGNGQETKPK